MFAGAAKRNLFHSVDINKGAGITFTKCGKLETFANWKDEGYVRIRVRNEKLSWVLTRVLTPMHTRKHIA